MVFIVFSRDSWGLKPINTHYIGEFPIGVRWDRGTSNYPLICRCLKAGDEAVDLKRAGKLQPLLGGFWRCFFWLPKKKGANFQPKRTEIFEKKTVKWDQNSKKIS